MKMSLVNNNYQENFITDKRNDQDYLVCGTCQKSFPLSEFVVFVNHKKFDCDQQITSSNLDRQLQCSSCSGIFYTPYSLLIHAQNVHRFNIYQEKYNSSEETIQRRFSTLNDSKILEETIKEAVYSSLLSLTKSNLSVEKLLPKTKTDNSPKEDSNDLMMLADKATENIDTNNVDETCKSKSCASLCLCPPEYCKAKEVNDDSISNNIDENESSKPLMCAPESPRCEDVSNCNTNCCCTSTEQCDCGIGLLLQKCCNSVVPKKRRRHVQKHLQLEKSTGQQRSLIIAPGTTVSIPTTMATNSATVVTSRTSDSLTINVDSSSRFSTRKRRYPTSKPFVCSDCGARFNQSIHLKKHMSKHTGIKPFKCNQCPYATVERSHLKVHIRVHTGEKPFKCTYCEYSTAQKSTLKIHLKRHHEPVKVSLVKDNDEISKSDQASTSNDFLNTE